MKKVVLIVGLLAMAVSSCKKEETSKEETSKEKKKKKDSLWKVVEKKEK